MDSIIILSGDICIVKQIINVVNKMNHICSPSILIFDVVDFKKYISCDSNLKKDNIYFIDIYGIEDEFLSLIGDIRKKDNTSHVVILNTNKGLKSLINSQSAIYTSIGKDFNFSSKIFKVLSDILNNNISKIKVSQEYIPVTLSKNNIYGIYKWPNKDFSISYKENNTSFSISFKKSTYELDKIVDSFYTDNIDINKKRKHYNESLKQLIVDLYLIYNIDCDVLSRFFHIDSRYIKNWSNLVKYNRKLNVFKFWSLKLVIKTYLKK